MKILLGMALVVVVGWSVYGNDKITSVEINGRQYTNINEVYVGESGKIVIVSPSIQTALNADDIPTNFLASWNINEESRKAANAKKKRIAVSHTWVLKTGETVTGDYVSSGTNTLVVKTGGTNCFLKISDLSTNDQAYVAEMKALVAKYNPGFGDIRYYSQIMGVWTNAASFFQYATNHSVGGKLFIELGNSGYIPADMWLGQQYQDHKDPCGDVGMALETGWRDNSPDTLTPYAKVMSPTGRVVEYDDSDPFFDESARWYLKAAVQGVANAQGFVGSNYKMHRQYTEALKWYNLSVANGNKGALISIADMYEHGWGVQQNMSKAIQLYADAEAYYTLSSLYLRNNNHVAAYTWWCVGNAKDPSAKKFYSGVPFTSEYANLNFTAAERAMGANAAAAYIAQRYGANTNIISTHTNSDKSKPAQ
jgi:TPR repeat protein